MLISKEEIKTIWSWRHWSRDRKVPTSDLLFGDFGVYATWDRTLCSNRKAIVCLSLVAIYKQLSNYNEFSITLFKIIKINRSIFINKGFYNDFGSTFNIEE